MKIFELVTTAFKLIIPVFIYFSVHAQSGEHYCGADELRMQNISSSELRKAIQIREQQLETETQNFSIRSGSTYIIPVVFHVIHNYGSENISDAQIYDAIRVLNNNYRKRNADTVDIIPAFQSIAADCEIELRIAQIDPFGNCTKGINRIASTTTYTGGHEVKQLIHWDPTKYLNVYIVANAAGLAGHAVWPADADTIPQWDGIVIKHDYVGSIGTSNNLRSVVLSHELGHYLNLHHIWGGNNVPGFYYLPVGDAGNCAFDDLVGDTPNTIGWSSCNLSASSCGSLVDNVQNFMDYAYCARMLSEGQKNRMHACLNSSIAGRNNLWSPTNLIATGTDGTNILCDATFEASQTLICAGSTITLTDYSYHGAHSRQWEFFGSEIPSSLTDSVITVSYPNPGVYRVKLTVSDGSINMEEDRIDYIHVLPSPGFPLPYVQNFETLLNLNSNEIHVNNPQADGTYILNSTVGYSGTYAAQFENYSTNTGFIDELIFGPFNATTVSALQASFRFAFCMRDSVAATDQLQVLVSNNCGDNWVVRKTLGVSLLVTAAAQNAPWVPNNSDWAYETVTNISASYLTSEFMIKFAFRSGGGNLLFLDDINLAANVGVEEQTTNTIFATYNSLLQQVVISKSFNLLINSIVLYDAFGRLVWTENVSSAEDIYRISTSGIASGVYIIGVSGSGGDYFSKLVIY